MAKLSFFLTCHLRNYTCVFDIYLEKFEALRDVMRGLRMLRIFSAFLKILNFPKPRFGGCLLYSCTRVVRLKYLLQPRTSDNNEYQYAALPCCVVSVHH